MAQYKHLFFDLDHTLWDFERNANECLTEIYNKFSIESKSSDNNSLIINNLANFLKAFDAKNRELWDLLEKRLITQADLRKRRFKETLTSLNVPIDDAFSTQLNEEFLKLLPHKTHLMNGAKDVLDYLFPKYQLHIITNGFDEIQATKMRSSEIDHYFAEVITHEKAAALKPDKKIFEFALKITKASASESLMIGDNYEADIKGAMAAGLETVFYNLDNQALIQEKPTFEIRHLAELKQIL